MNHPPVEVLIQHAFGMTTVESQHIAACGACADEVEELSSIKTATRTLEMPADLAEMGSRFDAEKSAAHDVLAGLEPSGILDALSSSAELATEGGLQALIESIPSIRRSDPVSAFELAQELILTLEVRAASDQWSLAEETYADALREAAACARVLSRYDEALELLEDAERRARNLPTGDYLLGRIWYERAGIGVWRASSRTREWASRAAEVFARFGDTRRYNRSRYLVAISYYNDRDYRQTIEALYELLPHLEADEDRETRAAACSVLGHALLRDGSSQGASRAFSEAMAAYESLDRPIDRLRASWGLARTDLKLGNLEQALQSLQQLRSRFRDVRLEEEAALVGLDVTETLLLLSDHEAALVVCRESMETLDERFSGREQKRALAYLSEITNTRMNIEDLSYVSDFLFDSVSQPGLLFLNPSA
ncbi:MAG: hypothetical protein KY432_02340 [Acidobacteria bacterium]|nr:hypothetical protein [Acidobacteriota bacterium]